MEKFNTLEGIAAPMPLINIDTDMLIPKQFLKTIKRTGLGENLFFEMRYDQNGNKIKDFILNREHYSKASIIVGGANFGCGSSREHAPWAIYEAGFRVLIAPSFADIFFNNSLKNGILPIVLSSHDVDELFIASLKDNPLRLVVDLQKQTISDEKSFMKNFAIDLGNKKKLMEGLDEIGLTLSNKKLIKEFEEKRLESRPWLKIDPSESLK